jgi:hypothetical protein
MSMRARAENRDVLSPATWITSFVVATALGVAIAFQAWSNSRSPQKPPTFWDARVIQPQLIPWYVWATLAPAVMLVLNRTRAFDGWKRWTMYGGLAIPTILLQTVVAAFALGWWWSFPSWTPRDPGWHINDLLRTRSVLGVLVYALIVAIYHARFVRPHESPSHPEEAVSHPEGVEAQAKTTEACPDASDSERRGSLSSQGSSTVSAHSGPIALRVGDRVIFVHAHQIDWIEADRDYVNVHVGGTPHRVRQTITAMEARLPADKLIRVSRSAIVNLDAVKEMQPWFRGNFVIILRNGARVTTGARYRDRLSRRL